MKKANDILKTVLGNKATQIYNSKQQIATP